MVNDTRSSRKTKVEDTSSSGKGKQTGGRGIATGGSPTAGSPSLRRSTRGLPIAENSAPAPPSRRKSEGLEKHCPGDTRIAAQPVKVEKQEMTTLLRRSERGKQNVSSSPDIKPSVRGPNPSKGKRKREKRERRVNEVTMEAPKVSTSEKETEKSVQVKKRRVIRASNFRALFIEQKKHTDNTDPGEELELNESVPLPRVDGTSSDESQQVVEMDPMSREANQVKLTNEIQPLEISSDHSKNSWGKEVETQGKEGTSVLSQKESWEPNVDDGVHTSRSSDASIHNVIMEIEDIIMTGVAERCNESMQEKELDNNGLIDSGQITCATCKLGFGGKFLCCNGKGCHLNYHPTCVDPPMEEVPPGVWHCPLCVRKKILFGPQSVSDGMESIWDAREMDLHGKEGMQKQRHLLVKYKGISHAYNQWVPEIQLLLEAPILVAEFNKQDEVGRWKPDWGMPHRLIKRRFLSPPKQCDECTTNQAIDSPPPHYEWLVKWRGLDYEHCTWELEDAPFFRSSEAQSLIRNYADRCERAKRASLVSTAHKKAKNGPVAKLLKLPDGCSPDVDTNHLLHVNKLRDCWHNKKNAVIFDDEDRMVKVIIFILSLQSESCLPFLIISDSPSLYLWESEFLRLTPATNAILYDGDREVRERIQTLEFYDNEGCVFFQVLLASPQAIVEDWEVFRGVSWAAAIVNDFPCSGVLTFCEHFVEVSADLRLVFSTCQLKENAAEYLNILSFLESGKYSSIAGEIRVDEGDNIANVKERLACYIAYDCRTDPSRFVEYWVPVQMSNVQLEQYCQTLISKSFLLCSKNDLVDALREILISLRKTCNHPFLVDPALQTSMIKGRQAVEYLDVGIKASGKLQLLDKMLLEIKKQGLRVLILYESIGGSGRDSIGDFLDDFLRQRFGSDSYERVDGGGFIPSRKLAALNNFNKESGRFVFLLQTCACLPSIKLSSVDAVIFFDSDWNPMTDSRALQRVKIDSQFEQIKVFRLYTTCTLEENILILSKYDMISDGKSNAMNQNTSRKLLLWAASNLFTELDSFHALSADPTASTLQENSHLGEVVEGLMTYLVHDGDHKVKTSSIILKIHKDGENDHKILLHPGELEIPRTDEELPHAFWSKLLKERNPRWIYLSSSTQRNRKRIQYFDDSKTELNIGTVNTVKRRKKDFDSSCSVSPKSATEIDKEAAEQGEGCHQSPNTAREHGILKSDSIRNVRDAQKSFLLLLKPEILRLCELLKLSESAKGMAEKFLQYIMDNHRVTKEPVTILQAFQLALCLAAASFLGCKFDRKESLALAKQHLGFCCTEEEVNLVHSILDSFMGMFSHHLASQMIGESSLNPVAETESCSQARSSQLATSNVQKVKLEAEMVIGEVSVSQDCLQQKWAPDLNLAGEAIIKLKKRIEKKCRKRMSDLRKKQKEELEFFYRNCDEEKAQLEREYKMEVAIVHSIHGSSVADKLKTLEDEYDKRFVDHKYQVELRLKSLMDAQLDAKNEEEEFKARCLEEMKSWAEIELKDKFFGGESAKRLNKSESIKELQVSEHVRTPDNLEESSIIAESRTGIQEIANVSNGVISNDVSMKSSQSVNKESGIVKMLPQMVETACEEAGLCIEDVTGVNRSDRCDGSIDVDVAPLIGERDGTVFPQHKIAESSCNPANLSSEDLDVDRATIPAGMDETTCREGAVRDITGVNRSDRCDGSIDVDVAPLIGERDGTVFPQHKIAESSCNPANLSSEELDVDRATIPAGMDETTCREGAVRDITGVNRSDRCDGSIDVDVVPLIGERDGTVFPQHKIAESSCNPANLSSEELDVDRATIPAGMAETTCREGAVQDIAEVQQHSSCEGFTCGDTLSSPILDSTKNIMPNIETTSEEAILSEQAIAGPDLADGGEDSCREDAVPIVVSAENVPTIQAVSNISNCTQTLFDEQVPQHECSHPRRPNDSTITGNDNVIEQIHGQQSVPVVSSDEHHIEAQKDEHVPLPSESPCAFARNPPEVQIFLLDGVTSSSNQCHNGGVERTTVNTGTTVPSCEVNLEAPMEEVGVQTDASPSSNLLHSDDTSDLVLANANLELSYQQSPPQGQANIPSDHVHMQNVNQVSYIQSSDVLGYQLPTPSDARSQAVASAQRATTPSTAASRIVMPSTPDPLQNELERMRLVIDQEMKMHDDAKLQLKLVYEKEMAEVRRKYVDKVQDVEAAFMIKKYALDSYTQKVYMNKLLAEAFRSKCMHGKLSGAPLSNQGSNFMRQQHQQQQPSRLSSQEARERRRSVTSSTSVGIPSASMHATSTSSGHFARPSFASHLSTSPMMASSSRPSGFGITSFPPSAPSPSMPMALSRPAVTVPSLLGQTLGSPRGNAPMRTSHGAVVNPTAATPVPQVQIVHDSSALFSNASTRLPQTTPGSYPMVNLQGQSGIRAQPPHLRRTSTSLPLTAAGPFPRGIPTQLMRTNPPTSSLHPQYQNASLLASTATQPGPYGKMPQLSVSAGFGSLPNSSVSALDLLTDVEIRYHNNLPVSIPSSNGDVVCLSDDD